jgi:hypothetical protein
VQLASDVVGRYDRLLQAFDDELKRRQQSKQDPNQGGKPSQQGGKPPLVPPVAELLLLKHLEEDVLQDVQTFRASADEVTDKDLDDARMKLLERLGHRHRAHQHFRRSCSSRPTPAHRARATRRTARRATARPRTRQARGGRQAQDGGDKR